MDRADANRRGEDAWRTDRIALRSSRSSHRGRPPVACFCEWSPSSLGALGAFCCLVARASTAQTRQRTPRQSPQQPPVGRERSPTASHGGCVRRSGVLTAAADFTAAAAAVRGGAESSQSDQDVRRCVSMDLYSEDGGGGAGRGGGISIAGGAGGGRRSRLPRLRRVAPFGFGSHWASFPPFVSAASPAPQPFYADDGMGNSHGGGAGGGGGRLVPQSDGGRLADAAKVEALVAGLHDELAAARRSIECLREELEEARAALRLRDIALDEQSRENDKLRSVLQRTAEVAAAQTRRPDILATIREADASPAVAGPDALKKKQGVSGESNSETNAAAATLTHYEKDFKSKQQIKDAILHNDYLKHLDATQIREMVNCMHERVYSSGDYIIREGEPGQHLFVTAEGCLEVQKDGKSVGIMADPGTAFGELAILYNCPRTASVKATEKCRVWALERSVYQAINMKTGLERQEEKINFLRSVQLLQNLPKEKLCKIADVLELDFFEEDAFIIREGETGDTFYIISKGEVRVTQKVEGQAEPQEIRRLTRGDYFGERALLSEERRTADVIAAAPGVECLTLTRDSFIRLIGDLTEFQLKDYGDEARKAERASLSSLESTHWKTQLGIDFSLVDLQDFTLITTLGIGGFGRVELVQLSADSSKTFALKCLKKQHVVDTKQQDHVYSEKSIMMTCSSPFIVSLYRTFKDTKYVYMLMEVCLGGELWTILRDKGHFDDATARFCVACVVAALQYLHARGVVYRDLKPENLLLSTSGYVKLVDFGFAKQIGPARKTWTFCGTPEYVAPEVILNRGHDLAVDLWALGILTYELCSGMPPFTSSDPMKTYNLILRGIDALDFSRKIGKNAQLLIKRLCRENPADRLGCQRGGFTEVKRQKWFQGFDWEGLQSLQLTSPLKPKVLGPTDYSNFDNYDCEEHLPDDELSGWDIDF